MAATDHPANSRGRGALSRRRSRHCPPASRTDEPQRWRLTDSHTAPPNASKSCRPDRRRWPTKGHSPQSLPERCLSASPGPFLEQARALRPRARKAPWRKVRQSKSISIGQLLWLDPPIRAFGSWRANAMFPAFVPGGRVPHRPFEVVAVHPAAAAGRETRHRALRHRRSAKGEHPPIRRSTLEERSARIIFRANSLSYPKSVLCLFPDADRFRRLTQETKRARTFEAEAEKGENDFFI